VTGTAKAMAIIAVPALRKLPKQVFLSSLFMSVFDPSSSCLTVCLKAAQLFKIR
jgi:hypothetical protein